VPALIRFIAVFTALISCGAFSALADPAPVPITILHTNDLHAHFRPEKTPIALGGIARIKTMVNQLRKTAPNPIFVDGGDWSEGDIYYTEGAGSEILKMMDLMSYDVAVVGNHDWLNGPDTLLNAIETAKPHFSMIAANFDTSAYQRADEFNKYVLPYVIRQIDGVKIAFIGLATYEFIYDQFIAPIKITEPFSLTNDMAHELKQVVDAVVVISHNRVSYNQALLQAAPDVDLVIGAHDHVKLTKPVIVTRNGAAPGWIVETGCWGAYLGRVDMTVTPRTSSTPGRVNLKNYQLIQMDRTVPEDPVINARIATLESAIENRMGPIFSDHIAETQIELDRTSEESAMGDFTADAYRATTGADIALDLKSFVYDRIHQGVVNSVDVYNSNPAVYNPSTGKTWTIKTLPMKGSTLSWIFNILMFKGLPTGGTFYTSGVDMVVNTAAKPPLPSNTSVVSDPDTLSPILSGDDSLGDLFSSPGSAPGSGLSQVTVNGSPLDANRTYLVAGGGGIFESINVLNEMIPNVIPIAGMKDTGIESWRSMVDHIRALSPVTPQKLTVGGRLESVAPDLGIYDNDVSWSPTRVNGQAVTAKITVQVKNYGQTATPESGPILMLQKNKNGNDLSTDSIYIPLTANIPIASLQPGESRSYSATVTLTPDRSLYSINAMIRGNGTESDHSNDDVLKYFTPPAMVARRK
jgi:5'-nucleotidase/UDP-sugar diphosphatase